MMNKSMSSLPKRDRYVIIKLDEVYLNRKVRLSGLEKSFTIEGIDNSEKPLEKRIQDRSMIVMADSINSSRSHTVANYVSAGGLNSTDIASKITEVIHAVEENNGQVLAVVSDGAAANKAAYKLFGIKVECGFVQNSIPNPCCTDRKIHFMHDVPHLFKCARNYFFKAGAEVIFKGKAVSMQYVKSVYLLDLANPLHKVCPKLTEEHFKMNESYLKMKVSLAVQIFSNSVANGIQFYRERQEVTMQGSENTEIFIRYMNNLFDALNATRQENAISEHGNLLQDLMNAYRVFTSSCISKFASTSTMNSLKLTVKSAIDICLFLLNEEKFKYVLTAKLNQDAVELRFSIVRGYSPNDHPDIHQFADINNILALSGPLERVLATSSKANVVRQDSTSDESVDSYCSELVRELRRKSASKRQEKEKVLNDMKELVVSNTMFLEDWGIEEAEPPQMENYLKGFENADHVVYYMIGYTVRNIKHEMDCCHCSKKLNASEGDSPVPNLLLNK